MKNGRYNLGIIGLGPRGVHFGSEDFQELGNFNLVCACDVFEEAVQDALAKFGDGVTGYTDVDEFLKHPGLDAVVVATSDRTHAEVATKVLAAGKHLYLEKPMAQTIEDCDRIVDAWEGSDTVFMVGLELRYCSLMKEVKKIVERGDIGSIKIATVVDNVSVGGNYYYHSARRKKEYIKSLILEKGTHSLDLANWIIDASPVKVYSSGGMDVFGGKVSDDKLCIYCDTPCPYQRNVVDFNMDYGARVKKTRDDKCVYSVECDVPDNSLVIVDYDNGTRMSYMECHFTPEYTREFTFVGDKGKLTAFYDNEQNFKIMVWKRHEAEPVYYYPEKQTGGHGGGDEAIFEAFASYVMNGKTGMYGIKGARDSAAIAIAAAESEETGMPVFIPLSKAMEGDAK